MAPPPLAPSFKVRRALPGNRIRDPGSLASKGKEEEESSQPQKVHAPASQIFICRSAPRRCIKIVLVDPTKRIRKGPRTQPARRATARDNDRRRRVAKAMTCLQNITLQVRSTNQPTVNALPRGGLCFGIYLPNSSTNTDAVATAAM